MALDAPVTAVSSVSPKRAQVLRKMGASTVRDLLSLYPRRYLDMSALCTVAGAPIGSSCTLCGHIHEVKLKKPRRNLSLTEITLVDATGTLIVTAFRQPWLADTLKPGMAVAVSGKVEFNYGFKRMTNPFIDVLEGANTPVNGVIIPVYPLSGPLKAGIMRRIMENALAMVHGVLDPLPVALRAKYALMSKGSALACIHRPRTMEEQRQARRRLAYEEVLLLELKLMQEALRREQGRRPTAHRTDGAALMALEKAIPFSLTEDQARAKGEILETMASPHAANHMLLGDVGTGKTVVAAFALAAAADTGGQALFMAPTEILARQHGRSLGPLLEAAGLSWGVLTGSTDEGERADLLSRLASGRLDVLFGTHALLEPDVVCSRCTLAIIDEQQRFGVGQRHALLEKGECPDALYLTATPIPRTLALALYGNLTLSYLTQRPHGTPPRRTFVHSAASKGVAYDAAREALARGEQVYVVCPLVGVKRPETDDDGESRFCESIEIEDDADMEQAPLAAAENEAAFLASKVFPDHRVGLVHGKMGAEQKQEAMERFRSGETDVLVATTVIEVGVDVPAATVMIVEDADRFGLAQLHQLRGRVGRGDRPGEVHLISGTRKEVALERLAAMTRTDDGFELASFDLGLRREGDILGNRQHGASALKLVNAVRDRGLIQAAWEDARAIIAEDPWLESEMHRPLAREAALVYRSVQDSSGG